MLTGLTAGVLVVLVALTMGVCLVLSGAFSAEECVLWTVDVLQSIVMQVGSTIALGMEWNGTERNRTEWNGME